MNILYVASEATPFIKTGGLADVAGSLPKSIRQQGHDIRVVLPLHSLIDEEYKSKMTYVKSFYTHIKAHCPEVHVFEYIDDDGMIYYFIKNDHYFYRDRIYGDWDDHIKYIIFSKASAMLGREIGFPIDVINANDWHSALVPLFVNQLKNLESYYHNIKTVFTIHNIKYQGQFGMDAINLFADSIGHSEFLDLEYYGDINFMKSAIYNADAFNTVSKTYAKEITQSQFAYGLDAVIRDNEYKLTGIVNGIDYDVWNPKTDPRIPKNYDQKTIKNKEANKKHLLEKHNLSQDKKRPLIGMVSRLTWEKGLDLILDNVDQIVDLGFNMIVLGTGDNWYEHRLREAEYRHPEHFRALTYFSAEEANLIYSASDLYMMPSMTEPCGISQLIALRYGSVPIVRETGGLKDTVKNFRRGKKVTTGFVFKDPTLQDLFKAVQKAYEIYNSPKEFAKVRLDAMNEKFDWEKSSKDYVRLYRSLK